MADEECRQLWADLRLAYTESAGHPLLRQEIAGLYDDVAADDVLVVAPEEGIFIAMNVLLARGDHVVCTLPGYQSLYEIARAIGCELTPWRPREDEGAWRFDPDDLAGLLRDDTRLVVVNFPHNPTGALPSHEEYERIVGLAADCGARLFSDEMYRLLEIDPSDRLPSACDLDGRAVTLSGMSKSFGLPGLRLGWLVTRDRDVFDTCAAYRDYTTICSSAPSEILALMGLRARSQIVTRHRERVIANLAALEEFSRCFPDFLRLRRPRGGSICFPRLCAAGGAEAFCQRLVEDAGIMLLPSVVFEFGDEHVRFGLGRADLSPNLDRLGKHLGR